MKKLIILFLLSIFSYSGAQTFIPVPGQTVIDQYWSRNDIPYRIFGDIVVESLTIGPGVTIEFDQNYNFRVDGSLIANGTFADSILFVPVDTNSVGWHGIHVNTTATNILMEFCKIERSIGDGLLLDAEAVIMSSDIQNNEGNGIVINVANVQVNNSKIRENNINGIFLNRATINLNNVAVSNNGLTGIHSTNAQDNIFLFNSIVVDNDSTGIFCDKGDVDVINSIIYNNLISIDATPVKTNVTFTNIDSASFPGEGNIQIDPSFGVGEDLGSPLQIYNDIYFPPSQGTIHNDIGIYGGPLAVNWLEPSLRVNQSAIDFGNAGIGFTKIISINIKNPSHAEITIDAIELDGVDSSFFSLESSTFSIPANDSVAIEIGFSPNLERSYSAEVTIKHSSGMIKNILIGNGLAPVISVSPDSLNFGSILIGADSVQQLTIYNNGNSDLIIYSDSLWLSENSGFSFEELSEDIIIPVLDSALINITFNPDDTGFVETTFHIISNDPGNREVPVSLSGNGIFSEEFFPMISVSPSAINFGEVFLNQDSLLNLTIYNKGLADLILYADSINFSGSGASLFTLDSLSKNRTIFPTDSTILGIRYNPTNSGSSEGILHIISNDPGNHEVPVSLSGNGIFSEEFFPMISVSPSALDFGEVYINQDSLQKLTIYNTGLADLILYADSIGFSGSGASFFTIDTLTNDAVITSGDSVVFDVKFRPTIVGTQNAVLNIYHNDKQNSPKQIPFSGIGVNKISVTIDLNNIVTNPEFTSGENGIIAFDIQSDVTVDSCSLFVRKGGEANYKKYTMANQNASTWQVEIDANVITERGLEYFLKAYLAETEFIFPDNGETNPTTVEITIPVLDFPQQTKENIYQLISVPVVINQQNLGGILNDDLGSYNNEKYRVFDYTSETGYVEIENLNFSLPPGKAVWLITKDPKSIDIENSKSVATDQNFEISLSAGWNMISNPFSFPVLWDDISSHNSLRFYDGNDWLFSTIMEPYKGYLVRTKKDTIISVPPIEYKNLAKISNQVTSGGWYFQVVAESKTASDMYNYAGVKPNSSTLIDQSDQYEPLPIGKYISIYFEIGGKEKHFSTDFQQLGQKGYNFKIAVESNLREQKKIEIIPNNLPNDFDWVVVSKDKQLNYGKKVFRIVENTRQFELLVGTTEFISEAVKNFKYIPTDITISQNFPNPFNPATTINFQLDRPLKVQMDVYNILGQKIKSLINETLKTGYHSIIWSGVNNKSEKVASGIYFLNFRAGRHIRTLKMILKN